MSFPPVLSGPRLILSAWQPEDKNTFVEIFGDPLVEQFMSMPPGVSTDYPAMFLRLMGVYKNEKFWAWAGRDSQGTVVVHIELKATDHCRPGEQEVVYLVAPEARGKGYAREALNQVLDFAVNKNGLKVVATVDEDNGVSRHILEQAGFHLAETLKDDEGSYLLYRQI